MEKLARLAIPLDMANTPDDVVDFFIRVARLKIEDLEGEIITRNKQLADYRVMLKSDPQSPALLRAVEALESIRWTRIKAKKAFRSALMKTQEFGHKMFANSVASTEQNETEGEEITCQQK